MFWLGITLSAGIAALTVVMLVRRPADADELGSMSHNWIAEHRVDSR
jgi:hypothetical protein